MDTNEILKKMSAEEQEKLYVAMQAKKQNERQDKREAYEGLRAQFLIEIEHKLDLMVSGVGGFKQWMQEECKAFYDVMRDYGQLKSKDQASFTITDGRFKVEVKSNKVKSFDERADIAAEKLVGYLKNFAMRSDRGTEDAMYQLAMTLLERNRQGDLDYKSISKLYEMEDKFDTAYKEIMDLFRESNTVYKTAVNYYFSRKNDNGVWLRIEPSFCRM